MRSYEFWRDKKFHFWLKVLEKRFKAICLMRKL
jgi:hypothetical protein